MKIPIYQVDAFTKKLFGGNPAAVCPLDHWIEDDLMQSIAAENNLSETAFFVPEKDGFGLRWFTPESEVDLCGHATLATAFVIFEYLYPEWEVVYFNSKGGRLKVSRLTDGGMVLDFPANIPVPIPTDSALETALGVSAIKMLQSKFDIVVVVADEEIVRACNPDFEALKKVGGRGIMLTAKSNAVDFVSRFFAPAVGVYEDPVTGSAHCVLTPYWSEQLGKRDLLARQISKRGGDLHCEWVGERVFMTGYAKLFLSGHLHIDT